MAVPNAQQQITDALVALPGVEAGAHRFGGTEYRLGTREIGHIHGDRLVDVPFPRAVRDEVVAAGEAEAHHILPESGWVSLWLRAPEDVPRALALLRRSYDLAAAKADAQREARPDGAAPAAVKRASLPR